MSKFGYVISIETEGKKSYYAIDRDSGGYPYWTNFLFSAKTFKNITDCGDILNGKDFSSNVEMASGEVYPPNMIHQGLVLNLTKTFGTGIIRVEEVCLREVSSVEVISELHPEENKKEKLIKSAKSKLTPDEIKALGL